MEKKVIDMLAGVIFIIMGFLFAYFSKQLARYTREFYFNLASEKGYKYGFLIGGVIFFIFGILILFQISS